MGQQDTSAREGIRLSSLMTRAQSPALTGLKKRTDSCTLSFDLHTHSTAHVCAHTQRQISKWEFKKNIRAYRNLKGWLKIYTQSIWKRMGIVSLWTQEAATNYQTR